MRCWLVSLMIAALAGAWSGSARADDAKSDAKAEAKRHADAATQLFNVQQYDKAADEYQQAYLLDAQPAYLYASAQAQRLGGDCTNALLSYKAFLRTKPKKADETKAQKNIERCEQELKDHPPPPVEPVVPVQPTPVVVTPVAPPPVLPPPAPRKIVRPWTKDWVGHVMVGGGIVAAAAGGVLFFLGRGAIADLNNSSSYDQFAAAHGDVDRAKLEQTIGISAMAAGGALIVGGIIHYVIHGRPITDQRVSAVVTPGGATLVFARSF